MPTNDPRAGDDRLTELEVKLSFAEDLLETLNRTVFRQQQELDRLRQQVARLAEQVEAALPAEPRNLREEIPPHY